MRLTETEFAQIFGKKAPEKRSKFRNEKCEWRGIKFDSHKERDRFIILYFQERDGQITDLNRQVRFQLLPTQKDENGKKIENPCFYVADFTYRKDGKLVVEDVKSKATKTQVYRLKKKLMLWFHGIRVEEV